MDPQKWWMDNRGTSRRIFAIASVISLALAVLLLYSDIKEFLSAHPLWTDLLVALPAIAVPVLAWFDLGHAAEANRLRIEANDLRHEENRLHDRIGQLTAAHDAERNRLLKQIASNTQRPATTAERNARTLRRHLGACASVSEGQGVWASAPIIAEVNEDDIVTLFTPSAGSNPQAWSVQVDCSHLEIVEIPEGSCPLRLKVLRRHGPNVQLGDIKRWEDRNLPAATPTFKRGGNAYHANYSKGGSSETRSLYVYSSADGANSFQLVASTGETAAADNVEISKRFLLMEVDYSAAGFRRSNSGTGGSQFPLYIAGLR